MKESGTLLFNEQSEAVEIAIAHGTLHYIELNRHIATYELPP